MINGEEKTIADRDQTLLAMNKIQDIKAALSNGFINQMSERHIMPIIITGILTTLCPGSSTAQI